jgi:hypothetical protein
MRSRGRGTCLVRQSIPQSNRQFLGCRLCRHMHLESLRDTTSSRLVCSSLQLFETETSQTISREKKKKIAGLTLILNGGVTFSRKSWWVSCVGLARTIRDITGMNSPEYLGRRVRSLERERHQHLILRDSATVVVPKWQSLAVFSKISRRLR